MSTRSYIGKANPDNTIEYVYCHFDGSPEIVGHLLLDHYQDAGKIDKLLALGWLSSLGRKMTKPATCDYNGYSRCITYHRDHGIDWDKVKPRSAQDADDFQASVSNALTQYGYLWDGETWLVTQSAQEDFILNPVLGPLAGCWTPLQEAINA